jgi:hypothetical protein
VRLKGLDKLKKKSIHLIGSRIHDVLACSIVLQSLRYRERLILKAYLHKSQISNICVSNVDVSVELYRLVRVSMSDTCLSSLRMHALSLFLGSENKPSEQ